MDNCYAAYPPKAKTPPCQGRDSPLPKDNDWAVKLKLASPAEPEGVWLRLPDYPDMEGRNITSGEIAAARDVLRVKTWMNAPCWKPDVCFRKWKLS